MTRWRWGLLAGTSLLGAGCGGDGASVGVRDSASVQIVDNGTSAAPETWTAGDAPLVEIGAGKGGAETQFAGINTVARLGHGEILVVDGATSEFRVFDSAGTFLRKFGGAGQGPGEFGIITWVIVDPLDSIRVYDPNNHRVTVFAGSGKLGHEVTSAAMVGVSPPDVHGWFRDGTWLTTANVGTKLAGIGTYRDSVVIGRLAADGSPLVPIGRFLGSEAMIASLANGRPFGLAAPFGKELVTAISDSLVFLSTQDRYEIRGYATNGSLRRIIRRSVDPRPVTKKLIAAFEKEEDPDTTHGIEARQMKDAITKARKYPDALPALGNLAVDRAGNLWVQDYHVWFVDSTTPAWHVFGPDGRLRAVASVPRDLQVTDFGADYLAGIAPDSSGAARARVYRIRRQPTARKS